MQLATLGTTAVTGLIRPRIVEGDDLGTANYERMVAGTHFGDFTPGTTIESAIAELQAATENDSAVALVAERSDVLRAVQLIAHHRREDGAIDREYLELHDSTPVFIEDSRVLAVIDGPHVTRA